MIFKKIFLYSLNAIMGASAIVGITLCSINLVEDGKFHHSIALDENGNSQHQWNLDIRGIYPGKTVKYDLSFLNEKETNLYIDISFIKVGDITLANYLKADIIYNQDLIKSDEFSSYFLGDPLTFNAKSQQNVLSFNYTMPLDVTNEAQNAVCDFLLNVSISSKEKING